MPPERRTVKEQQLRPTTLQFDGQVLLDGE
jgi:hypothetical protein